MFVEKNKLSKCFPILVQIASAGEGAGLMMRAGATLRSINGMAKRKMRKKMSLGYLRTTKERFTIPSLNCVDLFLWATSLLMRGKHASRRIQVAHDYRMRKERDHRQRQGVI
jgi:hypothetical protein